MPYEPIGVWLIDQWRQIGLNVKQEVIEAALLHRPAQAGDFDVGHGLPVRLHRRARPGPLQVPVERPQPRQLRPLQGPGVDELYDQQSRATDPEERKQHHPRSSRSACSTRRRTCIYTLQWHRIIPHSAKVQGLDDHAEPLPEQAARHRLADASRPSGAVGYAPVRHAHILKRLLLMIPTLLGVAMMIVSCSSGSSPATSSSCATSARAASSSAGAARPGARAARPGPADVEAVRRPGSGACVRLDFGLSMWTGAPIIRGDPAALRAVACSSRSWPPLVATLLAIPLGMLAALKQDTWVDYAVRIFSIAGLAMPSFWLGIVMILVLLIVFQWLPPMVFTPFWVDPVAEPGAADLAGARGRLSLLGGRHAHDPLGDAGGAARGLHPHRPRQGLWQKLIVSRHALKNALLPVLTVIGLEFAFLLGGLVVTEQVFNLNGLGLLFVAGRRPPRLHADPGAGPAGGLVVHRGEFPGRPRLRLARSAHPLPLMRGSTRRPAWR